MISSVLPILAALISHVFFALCDSQSWQFVKYMKIQEIGIAYHKNYNVDCVVMCIQNISLCG